jgi:hypothetical protein
MLLQIRYLYTDTVSTGFGAEEVRMLVTACESLIPEHAARITESLVLTRCTAPSRLSSDMAFGTSRWAFWDAFLRTISNSSSSSLSSPGILNQQYADIRLRLPSGGVYPAHRVVLASQSPYFNAMFLGGLKESSQAEINLMDLDEDVFVDVLKYVYQRDFSVDEVSQHGILQVLVAASALQVADLALDLENILVGNADHENAEELAEFAQSGNYQRLAKRCAALLGK